jgi:hypothetical protein
VAAGVLYALQPYHYLRGQEHYFLAAYYVIPLTMMVMIDICCGRLPFFPADAAGVRRLRVRDRDTVVAVVVALATSAAGAYYAFFSCALLMVAALYGAARRRSARPFLAGVAVTGIVVAGGVMNHAPAFWYQAKFGQNSRPHTRLAEEAEIYGLKVAQLVLPVERHNPVAFGGTMLFDPAALRSAYQAPVFKDLNESEFSPIGLVAACGYVGLIALCVLPVRRGDLVGALAALALAATLLGTIGGFGSVFNFLVSPQVRCYNRLSIFIAFVALLASCLALDRVFNRLRGRWRLLRWPGFAAVVLFGVWDQTTSQWFPDLRIPTPGYRTVVDTREESARLYTADAEFFARVEALIPGGMVFNYPFIEYPEARSYSEPGSPGKTLAYDFVAGYLHTESLRFSFGAMKGREWDAWARTVSTKEPVPRMLERVTLMGFEGLLVDSTGINPKRWAELKADLEQYLGAGAHREYHTLRHLHFYDLRGYRDALMRSYGPAGFEARAAAERDALVVLFLKGFTSFEPPGYEDRIHYCGREGLMVFVNRSAAPVTVTARMAFRTIFKGEARLTIDGDLAGPDGTRWEGTYLIDNRERPEEYARELVVPPGRHAVRFECVPLAHVLPSDSRHHVFTLLNFRTR